MCGFAGFLGGFAPELLAAMGKAIAHRGPDDAGEWYDPACGIGLAHRRLSIIDLSACGHQPMWDATGRFVIAYNGEIYNYRQLRDELISEGVPFRGHSDTEVLVNLWAQRGPDALSRLNGIFAFALWDTQTRDLVLVRDGMGVKPLYYAQTSGGLAFASELKAILQCRAVDRSPDPAAAACYVRYLWCPAPRTLARGVRRLEPGTALRVQQGRVTDKWHFLKPLARRVHTPAPSPQEASQAVRASLEAAVDRQSVADVEVGAFLSGGLDSSALVALACGQMDGERLPCFTIAFRGPDEASDGFAQDLPYAQALARDLPIDLHAIEVGPEMIDELATMIYHLDEPQADPAALHVLHIARLARAHGIKVLLSGTGADDIFAGYRRHYALRQERYWGWLPGPVRGLLRAAAAQAPAGRPWGRRLARAFQYAQHSPDERIAGYFRWLSPHDEAALFAPQVRSTVGQEDIQDPVLHTLDELPEDLDPLSKMLALEERHFLADHNLLYTDKMSMASGVEVRVPYLDPDLVALAARLPAEYKQHGRTGKWILRRAVADLVPPSILNRPKTGFGVPLRAWLHGPLRSLVDQALSVESLLARGLFAPEAVQNLLARDRAGRVDAAYPLFALVCIELWCRLFLDPSAPSPPGPLGLEARDHV